MKKTIVLFFLLNAIGSFAQISKKEFFQEFQKTSNDSLFFKQYSITPYQVYEVRKFSNNYKFTNWVDSLAFQYDQGDVIGPFEGDTSISFVKIIAIDSAYRMRVGNIWLNPVIINKDSIDFYSRKIFKASKTKRNS